MQVFLQSSLVPSSLLPGGCESTLYVEALYNYLHIMLSFFIPLFHLFILISNKFFCRFLRIFT